MNAADNNLAILGETLETIIRETFSHMAFTDVRVSAKETYFGDDMMIEIVAFYQGTWHSCMGQSPGDADLRRAASTIYYAVFHSLAKSCADSLINEEELGSHSGAWLRTYRALDHGRVRQSRTGLALRGRSSAISSPSLFETARPSRRTLCSSADPPLIDTLGSGRNTTTTPASS